MTFSDVWPYIATGLSLFFGFLAFRRGQKSEDTSAARELASIAVNTDYIKNHMEIIDKKQDGFDSKLSDYNMKMNDKIGTVERSLEKAHMRIDVLEEKIK